MFVNLIDIDSLHLLIYAYLDPGSGSFILQMILASLAGLGFVFRKYLARIFTFFKKENKNNLKGKKIDDDKA